MKLLDQVRYGAPAEEWPQIKAIGYAMRWTTHADGHLTSEVRYYISTRYLSGKRFAEAVRGHWSIESMHWVLDVTFREDDSRTRERTLGNHLGWLRRFAVTLLKRQQAKDSLRGKMRPCAYSTDFLTGSPYSKHRLICAGPGIAIRIRPRHCVTEFSTGEVSLQA